MTLNPLYHVVPTAPSPIIYIYISEDLKHIATTQKLEEGRLLFENSMCRINPLECLHNNGPVMSTVAG